MAKINSAFESFTAKLPRTGHEIGRDFKFTSSTGMVLPVWHHILNPGERINWSASMQTITQPLQRPAMCDVRQKIDLFFVPFSMLYTAFPQTMYQTNDYVTSLNTSNILNIVKSGVFPSISSSRMNSILPDDVSVFDTRQYSSALTTNFFDSAAKGTFRLLMHLGYNPLMMFQHFQIDQSGYATQEFDEDTSRNVIISPFALAAYQAIYQNYYRDDDRELRNINAYQLDYLRAESDVEPDTGLFQLRYHQRKRDYFTSVHVSPILSGLNIPSFTDSTPNGILSKVNNYLSDVVPSATNSRESDIVDNNQTFTQFVTADFNVNGYVSTGMLRSLFAVEKLNRITGRARKNYDSQVLAHLGFKVPRDIKHEISMLGSIDGNIGIDTVMSTSAAAPNVQENFFGLELGERAGSGYGKLGGRIIDFTAPCHGIVMAVYYSIPNQSYPLAGMQDKINNIFERLDFYQPEFDRLGMQPMYGTEVYTPSLGNNLVPVWKRNLMLGWQYRYSQFKQKPNVHSLAFYRPYGGSTQPDVPSEISYNAWSPWVLGRNPFDLMSIDSANLNTRTFQEPLFTSFMVSPCDLDDLFIQKYNTGVPFEYSSETMQDDMYKLAAHPWLLFQSDPFMHDLRVNCKLVSTMSVTGEPELD